MQYKDIILGALLGTAFTSIFAVTIDPLLRSLSYQFNQLGIPFDNVMAILGVCSIVALTLIGVYFFQRFRNRGKGGIAFHTISSETHLDSLIQNMELFIQQWSKNAFRKPSYKRKIETKSKGNWRLNLRKQANEIGRKNKLLKDYARQVVSIMNANLFNSVDENVDNLRSLAFELESVFESQKNLDKAESNLDHFISQGDTICKNFSSFIPQLEKIRKDL